MARGPHLISKPPGPGNVRLVRATPVSTTPLVDRVDCQPRKTRRSKPAPSKVGARVPCCVVTRSRV
eukprot:912482-Pyramimonas_sp.AAC.1